MKSILLFLVSIIVLFGSTVQADEEFIGPAYRVDADGRCAVTSSTYSYEGAGRTQYSNGKKGHATFKCKLDLTDGEGVISHTEADLGSFPLGGDAMCYTAIDLEVDTGTWTSQCFNAWESGD
jgi:hypothetical protein